MITCFYYWLIHPVRKNYEDSWDVKPVFEVPIHFSSSESIIVALFSDENGPIYARAMITNLESEEIPEQLLPVLQAIKEHMLSTLRFTFHPDTIFFNHPILSFTSEPNKHRMCFDLKMQYYGMPCFDADRAKRVFAGGFENREDIRLLVDAGNRHIPLQYRYLSLYKLIELHFKSHNRWKQKELDEFLDKYTVTFQEMGIESKPRTYLQQLRDKCAHIKSGSRNESFGVTCLNYKEAIKVEAILPILGKIAIAILNLRGKGKITITTRQWVEWKD